jgi:hypothetical protein
MRLPYADKKVMFNGYRIILDSCPSSKQFEFVCRLQTPEIFDWSFSMNCWTFSVHILKIHPDDIADETQQMVTDERKLRTIDKLKSLVLQKFLELSDEVKPGDTTKQETTSEDLQNEINNLKSLISKRRLEIVKKKSDSSIKKEDKKPVKIFISEEEKQNSEKEEPFYCTNVKKENSKPVKIYTSKEDKKEDIEKFQLDEEIKELTNTLTTLNSNIENETPFAFEYDAIKQAMDIAKEEVKPINESVKRIIKKRIRDIGDMKNRK